MKKSKQYKRPFSITLSVSSYLVSDSTRRNEKGAQNHSDSCRWDTMTFVPLARYSCNLMTTCTTRSRSTSSTASAHFSFGRLSEPFDSVSKLKELLCLFILLQSIISYKLPFLLHHHDNDNKTKTRHVAFKHAIIQRDPLRGSSRFMHNDNMYARVYNQCTKEYSTFSNNAIDG